MSSIKVFIKDSFELFEDIPEKHMFDVSPEGLLRVYEVRDEDSHSVKACFKNWDYFLVDSECH